MSYEDNFDLNVDNQISDYILHGEIGSGGFAKVVQGIHIPTGEKVAVKIMDKMQLFTDPLNLGRVKTEISILKIVRHKNIIKLYEVIETPQKIYLIMEYCEGGELFDYIVQKQHLTEKQACAFFHEILDALEYLHSINIVHRDIKPENLLLEKINKKISLKLIDFGISNIYTMHNLLITPCGTASYAPPEMHKGEKYYGLLTDIWSVGVVLYAMAFGYLPFCDDDEEINVKNIIEGNYEIPSSASPELYDLLLHLLDINPITRYDLDQIKMHPWYNMIDSNNNRPGLIIGYHKIPVDERIINICETYGYDTDKVRESVINNNYDNNSSIYYIILNKMKTMGIEWVFIGGVDNCLVKMVDPVLMGLAIYRNVTGAGKSVVKANPHEKVGAFCRKNGRPNVIEYSEITDEMAEETDAAGELLYGESHILCNLFRIDAIERMGSNPLPYHSAFKKATFIDKNGNKIVPDSPNAYKFEAFLFDAFGDLDDMVILRVKREEEFAPVKNATGVDSPETARNLYNNLHKFHEIK